MSTVLPSTPVDMYNRQNKSSLHVDDFYLIQMPQASFFSTEKNHCTSHFCKKGALTWRVVESDNMLDMVDENRDF